MATEAELAAEAAAIIESARTQEAVRALSWDIAAAVAGVRSAFARLGAALEHVDVAKAARLDLDQAGLGSV